MQECKPVCRISNCFMDRYVCQGGQEPLINAKLHLTERYELDDRIVSLLSFKNDNETYPLMSGFDIMLLLVIAEEDGVSESISHYIKEDVRIQERRVSAKRLEQWLFDDDRRVVIEWLLKGEIWLDRTGYLGSLRDRLVTFDQELRERKLLKEFARFLRTYLLSKEYLNQNYLLDAYTNILNALQHWARIAVIESGEHPEVIVWQQVHKINPGVYKLYDELTHSDETLKQRIQLLVLACEFAIVSKMKDCCALLLKILGSRNQPWSIAELQEHPQIKPLGIDLSPVLRKLVAKSLVKEVAVAHDPKVSMIEMQYSA